MNLTDRKFWEEHWRDCQYLPIQKKTPFDHFLPNLRNKNSFIEIGGFPGAYSIYFLKKGFQKVTLLDFYIDAEKISLYEKNNNVKEGSIQCIETDFFNYDNPENEKYDLVFSSGFIEHFQDTKDVIYRHVKLMSDDGTLLILIPNFRGLNGWLQKVFDKDNFLVHNLESMKLDKLKDTLKELQLKKISVEYSKKPMLWLEPKNRNKYMCKFVKLLSYFVKLFPVKGRFLSPFIIIYAEK